MEFRIHRITGANLRRILWSPLLCGRLALGKGGQSTQPGPGLQSLGDDRKKMIRSDRQRVRDGRSDHGQRSPETYDAAAL